MTLTRRAAYAVTRGLTRVAPVRAAPLHVAAVRRLAAALGQRGKSAAALALAESAVAEHRRRDAHAGTRGAFGELLRILAERRAIAVRPDEALAAADEAVPILERETGSTAGRVRLARAHAIRSDILLEMGRPDEAAADAETAIAALPQAGRLTSTERHALVLALRRQASSQLALGRYAEAGEQAGAALAQLGRLPWYQRIRLLALRTGLQLDLAAALHYTGQSEAAVALAKRAGGWAAAMDNRVAAGLRHSHARQQLILALALAETGDHRAAGVVAQQAVELYRRLADRGWSAYAPRLVEALMCLSRARAAEDDADPVPPIREAVEVSARLAAEQPERFAVSHARATAELADRLWAVGAHAESVAATRDTLDLYQRLPAAQRDETSDAAGVRADSGLTWRLTELGDPEAAARAGAAAVEQARGLAATGRHRDLLYMSLSTLCEALYQSGQRAAGRELATGRATVGRELAKADPARFGDLPAADQHWLDTHPLKTG